MYTLIDYGYTPILNDEGYMPARITAVHRGRFQMISDEGEIYGQLKSSAYYKADSNEDYPTVGDYVLIEYNNSGDSMIVKTLERKSVFLRKDPSSKLHRSNESDVMQAVAANFDYVFIVNSLNYDFNIGRIERYLTLAWQSEAVPVVILTKADLMEDYSKHVEAIKEIAPRVDIHVISSKTGFGIDELNEYLKPRKTLVFMGSSGVGKSSLLNALYGEELMKVNGIREDDSKGRHTTTHRQLVMLPSKAMIIDTPGMRELGMWDVTNGISETFEDVTKLISRCKFSNCTHTNEPGCAVLKAIEDGELSLKRYEDYNKILNDAVITKTKRDRAREGKEIGRKIHKLKKERRKR